jgi:hypothetical protein
MASKGPSLPESGYRTNIMVAFPPGPPFDPREGSNVNGSLHSNGISTTPSALIKGNGMDINRAELVEKLKNGEWSTSPQMLLSLAATGSLAPQEARQLMERYAKDVPHYFGDKENTSPINNAKAFDKELQQIQKDSGYAKEAAADFSKAHRGMTDPDVTGPAGGHAKPAMMNRQEASARFSAKPEQDNWAAKAFGDGFQGRKLSDVTPGR